MVSLGTFLLVLCIYKMPLYCLIFLRRVSTRVILILADTLGNFLPTAGSG